MARFRYRMNVAYWHLADIPMYSANVRFWENSGRRDFGASCPLLTQSGHRNLLARTLRNGPEIVIYVPEFGFGTHRVFADLLLFSHASKLA